MKSVPEWGLARHEFQTHYMNLSQLLGIPETKRGDILGQAWGCIPAEPWSSALAEPQLSQL